MDSGYRKPENKQEKIGPENKNEVVENDDSESSDETDPGYLVEKYDPAKNQSSKSYSEDSDEESSDDRLLSSKSKNNYKRTGPSGNNESSDEEDNYSVSSGNTDTWDSYLSHEHVDKEDDGIIFQMGNMFDNIREIGNLNFGAFANSNDSSEDLTNMQKAKRFGTDKDSPNDATKSGVLAGSNQDNTDNIILKQSETSNPFFGSILRTSIFKNAHLSKEGSSKTFKVSQNQSAKVEPGIKGDLDDSESSLSKASTKDVGKVSGQPLRMNPTSSTSSLTSQSSRYNSKYLSKGSDSRALEVDRLSITDSILGADGVNRELM